MKKVTLLSALLVSVLMFGQKLDVGVNFMGGYLYGNYNVGTENNQNSLYPGFGMGGGVEANYWFTEKLSLGLEVGYLSFAEQEHTVENMMLTSSATAIPIVAKGTYYMSQGKFKPLVGLGLGYTLYNPKLSQAVELPEPGVIETTWNQSGLVISPRLGFVAVLTDFVAINFNVQYNLAVNKVDGDIDVTTTYNGETNTGTSSGAQIDATNYIGANIGVLFTIFDDSGVF